jgi:hypothetical protein
MPRVFNEREVVIDSFVYACQSKEKQHTIEYLKDELQLLRNGQKNSDHYASEQNFNGTRYDKGFFEGFKEALRMVEENKTLEEKLTKIKLDNIEENSRL